MRAANPEWDFMSRTYSVLAFANLALREPNDDQRARYVTAIDRAIEDTAAEEAKAPEHFLMSYARPGTFRDAQARSLFLDGEMLYMLAARQLVLPDPSRHELLRERARRITRAMRASPSLSGESYPDECWTFCNTTALAALTASDRVLDEDHSDLARDWVAYAKAHLVEPKTGLLVSSYRYDGKVLDGPEGSSIWMSAHNMLLFDAPFAREQYAKARASLGASILGFGYAREWPREAQGHADVDSGPIIPGLEISAGSSGLAFVGAAAFGDTRWLRQLRTTLEFAGFPERRGTELRFNASNEVGDAVLLYALTYGPLFARIHGGPT